jgi:hypothetical protein
MNLYPGSWLTGTLDWTIWDEWDDEHYGTLLWMIPGEFFLLPLVDRIRSI